jgi:hypothetical protein
VRDAEAVNPTEGGLLVGEPKSLTGGVSVANFEATSLLNLGLGGSTSM